MSPLLTQIRHQPAWIALFILILLCLWVGSGALLADEKSGQQEQKEAPLTKVRVSNLQAAHISREITLYGRTEPDRIATLRAEVRGQVLKVLVKEGQRVEKGDKILLLEANDLQQRLISAKANLKQRKIELQAARLLGKKGYQSQTALALAEANVESAKATVEGLQLSLENTLVVAPFAGIVNQRFVEVGDLLQLGDRIATVVDLNPLVITADVTQNHIKSIQVGQSAFGRIVSGQSLQGHVRYISSVSDMNTNTFKVEVEVPNRDYQYVAGMSTELSIPLKKTWAVKVTPAVMALDEQGNLGVKIVVGERVRFVPIDIVKSDSQGVWLSGLGQRVDVITLGHGFVRDGDKVEVVYSTDQEQQP